MESSQIGILAVSLILFIILFFAILTSTWWVVFFVALSALIVVVLQYLNSTGFFSNHNTLDREPIDARASPKNPKLHAGRNNKSSLTLPIVPRAPRYPKK
jgi:uncharacterized protein (DUF58 family)